VNNGVEKRAEPVVLGAGVTDDLFDDFPVSELHVGSRGVDEEFGGNVAGELVAVFGNVFEGAAIGSGEAFSPSGPRQTRLPR